MGRTITADDSLQEKLTSLAKAGDFQVGLIIGQNGKDRDFIIHLAPTPAFDAGDVSPEDSGSKLGDNAPAKRSPTKSKADCVVKIDDINISQHARQVARMLPGGLEIIGLFIATLQTDFATVASQSKLRSVVSSVHKTTNKLFLDVYESSKEKFILHICTQTLKFSCKSIDLSDSNGMMGSLDLKFQKGIKFQQLNYSYHLDLTLWLPQEKITQSLFRIIINQVKPWAESVKESLVVIDSTLPDPDFLLNHSLEDKLTKKKGGAHGGLGDLAPPKIFQAQILDNCENTKREVGVEDGLGKVIFVGTIAGLAFVHSKATVSEAQTAVLSDLVRSVVARWEMHCDSLVEEQPSSLDTVLHEPPRRVFLEGGGLPVSLCDYLFPGDSKLDACQSAKELLDIIVNEENVDDGVEGLADVSLVLTNDSASDLITKASYDQEVLKAFNSGGSWSIFGILITFFVVIAALQMEVLTRLTDNRTNCILIAPKWELRPWFPLLRNLSKEEIKLSHLVLLSQKCKEGLCLVPEILSSHLTA